MTRLRVESAEATHGLLTAVRNVSIDVDDGEVLALVGANGAGKTTLLRAIAGAHRLTKGHVFLNGVDVTAVSAHKRVALGIALVPEGRQLFPDLTVEENLTVARARARPGPWTIKRVMEAFPMLAPLRGQRAGSLSGGQQQATAIARALMTNPRVLLLDEVSLGLSPIAVQSVYQSLAQLIESGTALVLVEQDLNRAMATASQIACMLHGSIVLRGLPSQLVREQITDAYFGLAPDRESAAT